MTHTFHFGFETVQVSITDRKGYKTDRETGEQTPYVKAVFKGQNNPIETKQACSQENPLEDVQKDARLIETGRIAGTTFYRNWMTIFFKKGETYDLVKKNGLEIKRMKGTFLSQDQHKPKTFYFEINGKPEPIQGYYYEAGGYKYLL